MSDNTTWSQFAECDPRCYLAHAEDEECNLCPEPRCLDHSDGYHAYYCDVLHCQGHDWDPDNGMSCFIHAAWCDGDCEGVTDSSCEIELPGKIRVCTMLADGRTWIDGLDATNLADVDAAIASLPQARNFLKVELEFLANAPAHLAALKAECEKQRAEYMAR